MQQLAVQTEISHFGPLVLRDYQLRANDKLRSVIREGCRHPLMCVPCGGGKTAMQAEFTHRILTNKQAQHLNIQIIIVEYSSKLVKQTWDKFNQYYGYIAEIEQAGHPPSDPEASIIIASAFSLTKENRYRRYDPRRKRIIMIDEAHHTPTPTTQAFLEYFGVLKGKSDNGNPLIGWTATPSRTDGKGLNNFYDQIADEILLADLIKAKWLARPIGYSIESELNPEALEKIKIVKNEYGEDDFDQDELAKVIDNPVTNQLIVDSYKEIALNGVPTLVFCANRDHSDHLAKCFNDSGIRAASIHYKTKGGPKTIEAVLRNLREHKIDVVCNVQLISEGYDDDSVGAVIIARQTQSETLFTQMCGRCMRPPKKYCTIIDIAHNFERLKLAGFHSLFGRIPAAIFRNAKGVDLVDVADEFETVKKKVPRLAMEKIRNIADLRRISKIEQVDLAMCEVATELLPLTEFVWYKNTANNYTLPISPRMYMNIEGNCVDQYEMTFLNMGEGTQNIGIASNRDEAIRVVEQFVRANYPDRLSLLMKNAGWRNNRPTEKQLSYLQRHGITLDPEIETSGRATELITPLIELEQRKLLLDAEKLLVLLSDPQTCLIPEEISGLLHEFRARIDNKDVDFELVNQLRRIFRAAKAEKSLSLMKRPRESKFFQNVRESIQSIYESEGASGFLGDSALAKLEEILQEEGTEQ